MFFLLLSFLLIKHARLTIPFLLFHWVQDPETWVCGGPTSTNPPLTVVTLWSMPLNTQVTPAVVDSMWEILKGLAIQVSGCCVEKRDIYKHTDWNQPAVHREALIKLSISGTNEGDINHASGGVTVDRRWRVWTASLGRARSRQLGLRRANINSLSSVNGRNTMVNAVEGTLYTTCVRWDVWDTQWVAWRN